MTHDSSDKRRGRAWAPAAILLIAGFAFAACQTRMPAPAAPVFNDEKLEEMDAAIAEAISEGKLPGGVLWLERLGRIYHKAYGERMVEPERLPMEKDTIFDAASLTKVVATTPAILLLVERGRVELDKPVSAYLPEFAREGKEGILVRHLLTHSSGLRPGLSPRPPWSGYEKAIELACAEKPTAPAGTAFRYSDINFILLGEIVARVSGDTLDQFAAREIFQPLGMADTGFLPPPAKRDRVAPTENEGGHLLHAVVHDPTARRMRGVAGHAGLFITASDLARYARMLLNKGELNGVRVFKPDTIALMTSVQSPAAIEVRRGLGWDIDSGYSGPRGDLFPMGSYGHTGWTGTSLWIDPFSRTFIIFLSNRNHPTEAGSVLALRRRLGSIAARAVTGFDFSSVPGALAARTNAPASALPSPSTPPAAASNSEGRPPVLNGIDVLVRDDFRPLKKLRVGLITNHTGIDRERRSTIDLLHAAEDVQLTALFSPEHGIRGLLDEKVSDSVDEKTGLTIYSLYGATRKPTPAQLEGLDALVFDIQDIGCRFYTYISTMGLAMEAAAEARIKFFVLDRVNPINGVTVDGPVLSGAASFTAYHPISVQHGMTVGELARMFKAEKGVKADLTVVPVEGWTRAVEFDQTGLPWTNPSPNMRSVTEAVLYPGIGLLETTLLSVGRGTDTPFERIGAPYVNDIDLARRLNDFKLPGIRFVPIRFTPNASVFKDKECGGVFMALTDRAACRVLDAGLACALTLHAAYPSDFGLDRFNRLLVHPPTVEAIRQGKSIDEIRKTWQPELDEFRTRRAQFLLYP